MSGPYLSLKALQSLEAWVIQQDSRENASQPEHSALSRLAYQIDDLCSLKNSLLNEVIRQRQDLSRLQSVLTDGGLLNACGVLQNSHQVEFMAGRIYAMEELFLQRLRQVLKDFPHLKLPISISA